MKNKTWRRFIIWILPVVAAFALAVLPQAAFAVEAGEVPAEETAGQAGAAGQAVTMEEPEHLVGGWEPAELIEVSEDVEIGNVPHAKKGVRKAVKGDSESVFVKSASTVGYDALSSDAQREYYQKIDAAAVAFMNAETDLQATTLSGMQLYVFATLNFARLGLTKDGAMEAFFAYDYDHPAYYWLNGSILPYSTTTLYMCTDGDYASVNARQEVNAMVISGVKSYANLAAKGTDTLDEIALVHDKIVNDIDYAFDDSGVPESAKWAHSVHGVFDPEYRSVVCEGYADAFAMVMNYLDIPNYYIVGTASDSGTGGGGGHAWNAVSADGGETYLYMDLTWDDFGEDGYTYLYFGMPATDFENSHYKDGPDGVGGEWLYDIPDSINDSFDGTYFKQGGFYYDSSVSNVNAFASNAVAKASRAGGYVSVITSSSSYIRILANALGVSPSYYATTYKGTNYYYMITKTGDVHTHAWSEPEYTWSSDNGTVTALRICEAPNCDIGMEVETVATIHDVTDATCEEDGIETFTAEFENEAFPTQTKEIITEAFGHDWGEWVVEKEATEDEPGLRVRTCQNDTTHIEQEVIPQLPHTHALVEHAAAAATCTEAGNSAYWECSKCGKYYADEDGTEEIQRDDWFIEALGHDWGEWEVTKEATEEETGLKVRTCKNDPNHTEEEVIPQLPHDHVMVEHAATAATCTEAGNSAYWECSRCHKYFADENGTEEIQRDDWFIEAFGHDYKAVEGSAVAATCTENGKEADQKCSRCEDVKTGKTIEAFGHDMVVHVAMAPTCTEAGNSAYWECSKCHKYFADASGTEEIAEGSWIIEALGHEWSEPVYTWAEDNSSVTAARYCAHDANHEHSQTETVDVNEFLEDSTCIEDGVLTYTSEEFENKAFEVQSKTVAIAAKGHTLGEAVEENVVEPTCTLPGSYESVVYCSVCQAELSREKLSTDPLGHDYHTFEGSTQPATPEQPGKEASQKCSRCPDVQEGATIASPAAINFAAGTYTYNGKAQAPALTVEDTEGVEIKATDYEVAYTNNVNAGTAAKATVKFTGTRYAGSLEKTFTINKAAQKMTVKAATKTLKAKKLKKKAQIVSAITVVRQGAVPTYRKLSGSAKLTVNGKTGKITVKKKTKKGTYRIKVRVTSATTVNYKAAYKDVTVTVKVKK